VKELKDYYEKSKNTLLLVSIPLWVVLAVVFFFLGEGISAWFASLAVNPNITWITPENEKITQYIFSLLIDFAAPTSIVVAFYFGTLKYIDSTGWKKKFPQYDVSGEWYDVTTYSKGIDANGWTTSNRKSVPSPVRIEQSCQSIEVLPSIGNDFEWHSLSADWDERKNLKILYEVEYYQALQDQGYPERRIGYESMHIYSTGVAQKKKPDKMVGKFWHCLAYDGKPMYMGDVVYQRTP